MKFSHGSYLGNSVVAANDGLSPTKFEQPVSWPRLLWRHILLRLWGEKEVLPPEESPGQTISVGFSPDVVIVSCVEVGQETQLQIEALSQEEMARLWRFAPAGHPFLTGEVGIYFRQAFKFKGGMTPELSKKLGWRNGEENA